MTQTDVRHEGVAARGLDTRERILDAAERLFADYGVKNTSLRQITGEAQVNLAAINYHFQSKEHLVAAILKRMIEPINERRFRIMDALEAGANGRPLELEALLKAFLQPIFEANDARPGAPNMPRLFARLHSEPGDLIKKYLMPHIAPVAARFFPAFRKTLPGISEVELGWQIHFVVGALVNSLSAPQTLAVLTHGDSDLASWPEVLDRLIAFCPGGMRQAAGRRVSEGGHSCAG